MKKTKANVLLTSLILTIALILLGIFGCDMACVVLTRYKLQKATEAIATETASSLAKTMSGVRSDAEIENIANQYLIMYNRTDMSDLYDIKINRIDYKTQDNSVVVRVSTKTSIRPTFLRFVGTRGIIVYAISYAKTERIDPPYTARTDIANDRHFVEFNLSDNPITNKPRGQEDFAISFQYDLNGPDGQEYNQNGGYFIFGNYKNDEHWADIGYSAADRTYIEKPSGINIDYCINNANGTPVSFTLSTDDKDSFSIPGHTSKLNSFTKKVDKIRIYRTVGIAVDHNGVSQSTCVKYECPPPGPGPGPVPGPSPDPAACNNYLNGYLNRDATVTLTVLNNVKLISKNDYMTAAGTEITYRP